MKFMICSMHSKTYFCIYIKISLKIPINAAGLFQGDEEN